MNSFIEQSAAERTKPALDPTTRSAELFYLDIQYYGAVRLETAMAVLDEEQTNAAEDIARAKSGYAVVPRTYFQKQNDLVDIHGVSLKQVFKDGVAWAEQEAAAGALGAEWELQRRRAELSNLNRFIGLGPGSLFIEISAPPDRPVSELNAQGYTGMTHVRVSAKDHSNKIRQYNFILPASDALFLNNLQELLGVSADDRKGEAQALLGNPVVRPLECNIDATIREIESACGAAILNTSPDQAVLQMIKKAAGARKEAWEFVRSDGHADLNEELKNKIAELAKLSPSYWREGMARIRTGYMKELRERYEGKARLAPDGSIIDAAAAQAVAESDVFITCGGAIIANTSRGQSAASHAEIAEQLLHEVQGTGVCQACGARGTLYGCGIFCGACNRVWCAEYARSGKELSYAQIRYLRHGKLAGEGQALSFIEEIIRPFSEWNRRYEQAKEKKRIKLAARQRAEAAKLA